MSDEAKNLLNWFGKRKENVVQDGLRSHALSVFDCVNELGQALRAMENGDTQRAMQAVERLFVNEREADALEDQVCAQLSIGELSLLEREDLLQFVRETDNIANWGKEAALHVMLIKETQAQVPTDIWNCLARMTSILESEVNYLMNAIKLLGSGSGDEIRACIEGVKEEERRIDQETFNITKQVHLSDMEIKSIMLTRNVIDAIEMAADTCKNCADTISILILSRGV